MTNMTSDIDDRWMGGKAKQKINFRFVTTALHTEPFGDAAETKADDFRVGDTFLRMKSSFSAKFVPTTAAFSKQFTQARANNKFTQQDPMQ